MFELQFILIGVIQGITEFLPISSSGHLVLFGQLSNWEDQGLFTDIAVHFGTLFAVIFYLRKDIFYLFANVFQFKFIKDQIIFKIILSTLPAILIGYFIYDYVSIYFRNVQLIAISSILFLFSFMWMFYHDNDDEFKQYQKDFRKLEIQVSEQKLEDAIQNTEIERSEYENRYNIALLEFNSNQEFLDSIKENLDSKMT